MQFDDPISKLMREAQAAAQAHSRMMEAVNGPQWLRDMQLYSQGLENSGITKIMRDAQEQIRMMDNSGALKFMREAQAAAQSRETSFASALLDIQTQQKAIAAANQAASWMNGVRDLLVDRGVTKLVRDAIDNASLYRRLGLDYAEVAASFAPAGAAAYMEEATIELQAIEAGLANRGPQYDAAAVTASFSRLIHSLAQLIDGEGSSVERRAAIKLLGMIIPILLALWIWHAQHLEYLEGQASSDKAAQIAHQDAHSVEKAIEGLAERFQKAQEEDKHGPAYYDVIRLVPLCSDKKFHGDNLFVLLPGSEVEVIKRDKKWLQVCAIGLAGETQQGWVLKKYMRRQQ